MTLREEVKIRCWGGDGYRSEFMSKAAPAILGHNCGHASVEITVKKGKSEDKIRELKELEVNVSEITEVQNPISSYGELLKLTEEHHKNGVRYFDKWLITIITNNRDSGIPIEEIMQQIEQGSPFIYDSLMKDRSFYKIYFSFWPDPDDGNRHYLNDLPEDYWEERAASPISESDFMYPSIDQEITDEEKRKQIRTQRKGLVTNKVALSTIGKRLSEEQKNIEIEGCKLKDIVNNLVKCYRDIDSLEGDIITNEKQLKTKLFIETNNGGLEIPEELLDLISLCNNESEKLYKLSELIKENPPSKQELEKWQKECNLTPKAFEKIMSKYNALKSPDIISYLKNNFSKIDNFSESRSIIKEKLKTLKHDLATKESNEERITQSLEEHGYEDLACIGKEPDATIELPLRNDDTPGLDFEKMLDAMKDVVTDGKKFNLYEKNCSSTSAKIISAGLEGDPRFDSIKSRLDNLMEDNDYVRNIPDSVIAKLIKRFDPGEDYKTGTFSPAYIRKEANKIKQEIERPGEFHIEFIEDLIDILRDLAKLIHDLIQIKTGNDWVSRYENSEVIREPGKTSMVSEQTSRSTKTEKDKPMDAKNLPPNLPPEIV